MSFAMSAGTVKSTGNTNDWKVGEYRQSSLSESLMLAKVIVVFVRLSYSIQDPYKF